MVTPYFYTDVNDRNRYYVDTDGKVYHTSGNEVTTAANRFTGWTQGEAKDNPNIKAGGNYNLVGQSEVQGRSGQGDNSEYVGGKSMNVRHQEYQQYLSELNTKLAEYSKASGEPLQTASDLGFNSTGTFDNWKAMDSAIAGMKDQISSIGIKAKDITDNKPEEPTIFNFKGSEYDTISSQAMADLQKIVDRGEPAFTKPEFDAKYTTDWANKLQQIEQPNIDWSLEKLNKQVGDQYAFYNPYSLGSGTQMKATQEANNELLMNVLANRNAQALALGQTDYQNDYNKAYADYNYQQQQLANAKAGILDINAYRAGQEKATVDTARQDYYNIVDRNRFLADTTSARNYQDEQERRQQQYARDIANMYQPQTKSTFEQMLPYAINAAGAFFAPVTGGASLAGSTLLTGAMQANQPNYNSPYSFSAPKQYPSYYNTGRQTYDPNYIPYDNSGLNLGYRR